MITAKDLKAIAPQAKSTLIGPLAKAMNSVLPSKGIDTPLRIVHFLAQAAHETDGYRTLVEYWGPTKAQIKYEGRKDLGNVNTGDGKRFMGRGIFQLTGRANYRTIGKKLSLPLETNPELAADPENSVKIAAEYWNSRKINAAADADDIVAVTRKINGGINGLEDRRTYLARAKEVMDFDDSDPVEEDKHTPKPPPSTGVPPKSKVIDPEDDVILTPNSGDELIALLQKTLNEKRYGKLNPDGDWGRLTSMAVVSLQEANDLPLNGVSIPWADVEKAPVFEVESRKDMKISDVRQTDTEAATELNKTTLVKGGAGAIGVVTAGEETGFFKMIGTWTEQVSILKPAVEVMSSVWTFALDHLGWVALAGAVGIFFVARNSEYKIFQRFKEGD